MVNSQASTHSAATPAFVLKLRHVARRRRSAQFLQPPARLGGAAFYRPRHPQALGRYRRASALLGLGYASPYLGQFREEAERCLVFMPAEQGVVKWPTAHPTLSALVEAFDLPLPDASIDRVLLIHGLEMSQDAAALLRELWRVLAAGGQLLAVVPNRRGVWARMDNNPFGHGRPYSRSQITSLLRETWFTPVAWSEALYVPPIGRSWFLRSAGAWERVGALLPGPFAGVHIVEATKQVYRALPARPKRRNSCRNCRRCWRLRRAASDAHAQKRKGRA